MLLTWAAIAATGDPCADAGAVATNSARLRTLFDEDAADRASHSKDVYKNDTRRIKEILGLQRAGALCTPTDKYLAASVVQHSQQLDEMKIAYDLAVEAMNGHAASADWLVALTFDRYKIMRGLPQWYGTQYATRDDKRCIYPVDPATTDAERALHSIPPIAEAYARVLTDAGKVGYEPTFDNLVRYALVCESVVPH